MCGMLCPEKPLEHTLGDRLAQRLDSFLLQVLQVKRRDR